MNKNVLKGIHNTNPDLCKDGVITCGNLMPYDLINFDKSMVDMDFMINSVSKINRYNGHNKHKNGYSVAQHSHIMAMSALMCYGDIELARQCLFHDLPEAYVMDMVKPMKNLMGKTYADVEKHVEKVVYKFLDLPEKLDCRVKEIDKNMAQFEMSIILHDSENVYGSFDIWSAKKSRMEFSRMVVMLLELCKYQDKNIVNLK